MSWFNENKFVAVFGGVMVIGVGALAYLMMGAKDEYATAKSDYEAKAGELQNLQGAKPGLTEENLKAFLDRQKALKGEIDAFQKDLASREIKLEPITPTGFQDKLTEAVGRMRTKAVNEMGWNVPAAPFYFGFEEYQNSPPKDSAAPPLLRQLRGIEAVMELLLQSKGGDLKKITRVEVPEEKKEAPKTTEKKPAGSSKPDDTAKLVQRTSFTIEFAASQSAFQKVMNGLASHPQQFFVVRNLQIVNEKTEAKKDLANAQPPAPPVVDPNAPPAPPAPPAPKTVEKVLGNEKVIVTLNIDMLDFAEPEIAAAKAGANKPK